MVSWNIHKVGAWARVGALSVWVTALTPPIQAAAQDASGDGPAGMAQASAKVNGPSVRARTGLAELRDQISALQQAVAGDETAEPAELSERLAALDASVQDLSSILDQAETDAAEAWVKMACYTAWIVSRESQKKGASLRLIEITRATGKAGEVERYQSRHEMLLGTIQDASARYAAILDELARLPDPSVAEGFALHEQDLIEKGLAQRIRVLNQVKAHHDEYTRSGGEDLSGWQRDLEEL